MTTDRAGQLIEAGIWLKLSGDRDGAMSLFERALNVDPTNEKARQLLESMRAAGAIPSVAPVKVAPLAEPLPPLKPKTIHLDGDGGPVVSPATTPPLFTLPEEPEWRRIEKKSASSIPTPQMTPPQFASNRKAASGWDLLASDAKPASAASGRPEEDIRSILRGARNLIDLDDHTGAMEMLSKAHSMVPEDPEVRAMRERSEKTLLTMFESKLGSLTSIPRVLLKDDEIIWLNLDHRAGFVLAQIDGTVSFDDLFSVSGLSRIDTARILAQLVEEGVISRG